MANNKTPPINIILTAYLNTMLAKAKMTESRAKTRVSINQRKQEEREAAHLLDMARLVFHIANHAAIIVTPDPALLEWCKEKIAAWKSEAAYNAAEESRAA